MDSNTPLLAVNDLHKSFNVPVLTGVNFSLLAGEVHALMGANGAGKSTLSNIICGLFDATSGRMSLLGKPYAPSSVNQAEALGVRLVMQELNLINNLSVAENIGLKALPNRWGWINYQQLNSQARVALKQVGLDSTDPATPMHELGVGQQQLVEIAATLIKPCRLLILDEPTAALTDPQIDQLFEQLNRLKAEGVGIIYISHRMEEIQRIADRITVLRDGKSVATLDAKTTSVDQIVTHMTGEAVNEEAPKNSRARGELALQICNFTRAPSLNNVNLSLYRHEILGISGLIGAGRTELLRAIIGADKPQSGDSGYLNFGNKSESKLMSSPAQAVKHGIGLIPEDRKQQGLLLGLSIEQNFAIANLKSFTNRWGFIDKTKSSLAAGKHQQALAIKCSELSQTISQLSGGNQQKVIIARWLERDCDILLFDEPTRGIDIQTKKLIYKLLNELAERGKAIVVVSSETSELTTLCDRIAVMSNGTVTATFARGQWNEEKLLAAAFSGFGTNQVKPANNG